MNLSIRTAIPLAAVFMLATAPLAQAKTVNLTGSFVTEGSATTSPSGNVTGTLDTMNGKLTYTIVYSGLSGPVIASHFHGPATADQTADILLPIPGPYKTGMQGTLTANSATVKAILDGMTYVNLHTTAYPMGEARAQIKVSP